MESTLSAAFADLEGDIGSNLGYGRGARNSETAFDSNQQANVTRCVKGGLRRFYFCGVNWTFLTPLAELTLASGDSLLQLPDDYGGIAGPVHVASDGGSDWCPLEVGQRSRLHQMMTSQPDTTGRPVICCDEPIKGTTASSGQRFRLRFWPTADQAYTIRVTYRILPDFLTGNQPYVYGGAQHAETVLQACLAVAEQLVDDRRGIHEAKFQEMLAISKHLDARHEPQNLGVNRDLSDAASTERRWRGSRGWPRVTVNSVEY